MRKEYDFKKGQKGKFYRPDLKPNKKTQRTKESCAADFPAQNAIDQAWAEEVERRCIAVDSGKAKLIPGEEVFEKIKKRFSK